MSAARIVHTAAAVVALAALGCVGDGVRSSIIRAEPTPAFPTPLPRAGVLAPPGSATALSDGASTVPPRPGAAPPSTRSADSSPPRRGRVIRKDGTTLNGKILVSRPGEYVVVVADDGPNVTLSWDRIEEVVFDAHDP